MEALLSTIITLIIQTIFVEIFLEDGLSDTIPFRRIKPVTLSVKFGVARRALLDPSTAHIIQIPLRSF